MFCRFRSYSIKGLLMQTLNLLYQGERNCLWRDCGFCSLEGPEDLRRHLYFHCYHTKLKQLGQQVLNAQPEIGTCSIGYHNRNIVPELPDNFTCLWEECEVSWAVAGVHDCCEMCTTQWSVWYSVSATARPSCTGKDITPTSNKIFEVISHNLSCMNKLIWY